VDLSKLPKLSNTAGGQPPASANDAPIEPRENATPVQAAPVGRIESNANPIDYMRPLPQGGSGIGPYVWFNTIVGILLLCLGWSFARYAGDKLTGKPFDTKTVYTDGPLAGQTVGYWDLDGFQAYTESGMFIFGIVVLLEAAIHAAAGLGFRVPKLVIQLLIFLTVCCTAFNLYICVRVMSAGTLPLMSGLAAAFGGFILAETFALMKSQNLMRNMQR
jgi:hypothetical protein